jgi:hypothetical protein
MPRPAGVILTSEHIQHFQPRSFRWLTEIGVIVPVHVSNLMSAAAVEILKKMGFLVRRHSSGEEFEIGGLTMALFGNPKENLPWDRRAVSLYACDSGGAAIIQSDCKPSVQMRTHIAARSKPLNMIAATNNAVAVHPHSGAGLTNFLPMGGSTGDAYLGVRLLVDSLLSSFEGFPLVRHMSLSGGAFRDTGTLLQPLNWTNADLAKVANALSLGTMVHAPLPAESLDPENDVEWHDVSWVTRRLLSVPGPIVCGDEVLSFGSYLSQDIPIVDFSEIAPELDRLAKVIVLSHFGRQLSQTHRYLGRYLGCERFCVQLVGADEDPIELVLDLAEVRFKIRDYSSDDAIRNYPFGIRAMRREFCALLIGGISVWEFSMISARQWYAGSRFASPMSCLYTFFDEAIRQDLAARHYDRDLALHDR